MTEYAVKECVFHFNKKHLEDPTIPMWVVKFGGKTTLYVNHVECNVPWSTKETPMSSHTKGAIKIKKALITITDDNDAVITPLAHGDITRVKKSKQRYARIIITSRAAEIEEFLKSNSIKHDEIKKIRGGCGSTFYLTDINTKEDLTILALTFADCYRILQPTERYYAAYDDPKLLATFNDDEDEYYDDTDEDELD